MCFTLILDHMYPSLGYLILLEEYLCKFLNNMASLCLDYAEGVKLSNFFLNKEFSIVQNVDMVKLYSRS